METTPPATESSLLRTLAAVGSLLASYGLLILGLGLFSTLLSLRTRLEGFPTAVTGLVMAAYFLGLLVGAREAVRVVARVGHIRAFAAFASVMSVTALAHVLLIHPAAWAVLRFLSGFCMAGMVMVTESWMNERASNASRGQVMSLYMITNYVASGAGQLLVPVGNPASFELFSLASIIFSLALVPVLLTRASAPLPNTGQRVQLRELYRTSPLGMVGASCSGLVNAALFSLAPVFARSIGLSLNETSVFMGTAVMSGFVLQYPIGRISDHIDRRWVLAGVSALAGIAALGIVFAADAMPLPVLYATAFVYGSLAFTIYAVSAAHCNDFAPPERLVQVSSGLLFAYGIGASSGPVIASAAMTAFGPRALFTYIAAVLGGLALFSLWRMTRRSAPEERAPVITVPDAQVSSQELYTTLREESLASSTPPGDEQERR